MGRALPSLRDIIIETLRLVTLPVRLSALIVLVLVMLPASLAGQEPADTAELKTHDIPVLLERYEQAVREAAELEERLEPVREEAVRNSEELREAGEALRVRLLAAYDEQDPGHAERVERAGRIAEEARAAQAAGDHGRMQALEREAEEIRQRMGEAQTAVFAREDVAERIEAYQLDLVSRMSEIDPGSVELIEELDRLNGAIAEIEREIRALMTASRR